MKRRWRDSRVITELARLNFSKVAEDLLDIVAMNWHNYSKATTYRSAINEYRRRYPGSKEYGVSDSSIERIMRFLVKRKRLQRGHISGSPVFVPGWVLYFDTASEGVNSGNSGCLSPGI